jgi:transposase
MTKDYSPEVKAAVMASLIEGQSIRQVSREHGVPKTTVARWGEEASGIIAGVPSVPDTKKEQIGGLLIDLLVAKLESQVALHKHTADKGWLNKQEASALAMLIGVSDDKLIRLLEKFEDDGSASQPAQS